MIKSAGAAITLALAMPALAQHAPDAWFGTWKLKLKSPTEPPETLVYSDAGGGAMRMASVEQGSVLVTRLDGVPSTDLGGKGDGGPVLAVKATSPVSYIWTYADAHRSRTLQGAVPNLSDRPAQRALPVYRRRSLH
ncbi:hypothetical protein ABC347_10285 [Sphingomonas sp. 1P06PA]|uniref:hypothetical protein n=1 Tax=Sphingomonas sp. 1P06PA TaxID=554121 RepID=UPI0039A588DB